jgi:hypothetical protein
MRQTGTSQRRGGDETIETRNTKVGCWEIDMRRAIISLVARSMVLALLAGCGGGLTQEDMMRHAIRRPSDNEETESKPATSKSVAKADSAKPGSAPRSDEGGTPSADSANAMSSQPQSTPSAKTTPSPVEATSQGASAAGDSTNQTAANRPAAPKTPARPLGLIERRQRTIDNLTMLGDAVRRYCEKEGKVFARAITNPKGEALLSWRVELLPYLGYQDLYDRFDLSAPWDSPRNKPLAELIPDVYQSPERFDEKTNYLVPVASFTAFGRARGIGTRNIEDGLENTVLVVEVDDSAAVPWTKPEDLKLDVRALGSQFGSLRDDGTFVVWGDGKVTRVTPERSAKDLKAILSFDGGDLFTAYAVRARAEAAPAQVLDEPNSGVAAASAAPAAAAGGGAADSRSPAGKGTAARVGSARMATPRVAGRLERQAVPDSKSLDRARRLVREIYGNRYDEARTARDQQMLAKDMLNQLSDMVDDPAGQYVVLDIVIQISTQTGDSTTTIAALEEMLDRFEVDELQYEHDILKQMARKRNRGQAVNQSLLDETSELIERALQTEDFDIAESLCQIALGAARQMRDEEQSRELEKQQKLVAEARRAYQLIHRTIANLDDADDPKANLDVGRYYCLIRGEWEKGLPLLAKSDHAQLQSLALAELRAPTKPTEQVELADRWWELSEQEQAREKTLRLHAASWYLRALEGLPQGLLRVKAELRIKQVEKDYGPESLASLGPAKPS